MDTTLMRRQNSKGQALVESILLFFPILLLSFYGFSNLHEEKMQEFNDIRALRQVMLKRSIMGPHDEYAIMDQYTKFLIKKEITYSLPKDETRSQGIYGDKFPSTTRLAYNKINKIADGILAMAYKPMTVKLTFEYEVDRLLSPLISTKEKSVQGTMLISSTLRDKGMKIAFVLGVGGAFLK